MEYYENAIKDPRRKNRPVTYEWEITKEQWQYCFKDWLKGENKPIFKFVISFVAVAAVMFFLFFFNHYRFAVYTKLIIIFLIFMVLLMIAVRLFRYKKIQNPHNYKFFIDEQGIFNGVFYAFLDSTYKKQKNDGVFFNDINYISYGKYKLYENKNEFELLLSYWEQVTRSRYGRDVAFMEKWFCFVFNDDDKEHLYAALNNWQKVGKIEPFSDSDKEILKNYLS